MGITQQAMTKLTGKDDWGTPKFWVDYFERNYSLCKFEIDACASDYNHKCEKYFDKKQNMFRMQLDKPTFMNPIYGKKGWHTDKTTKTKWFNEYGTDDFIKFAHAQHIKHKMPITVLVFANISSSDYYQKYVGETPEIRHQNNCDVFFPPKRIQFEDEFGKSVGTPSLSSMVICYDQRFA